MVKFITEHKGQLREREGNPQSTEPLDISEFHLSYF